jgi:hypothetical protein
VGEASSSGTRCRVGIRSGAPCPRPATVAVFGEDPPQICEYHNEWWRINNDLGQAQTAQRMLVLWEEQAEMLACPPLEDAMRFVRAEADLEVARLQREQAELEEEERAGG